MAKTSPPPEGMTCSAFSSLMRCDRHTLAAKLEEIHATPQGTKNGGKIFALKDLVLAFAGGDERGERIRKLRAESERLEIQNARSHGELVEVARVKKLGQNVMAAIKNKILGMPMSDQEQEACLKNLLKLRELDFTD